MCRSPTLLVVVALLVSILVFGSARPASACSSMPPARATADAVVVSSDTQTVSPSSVHIQCDTAVECRIEVVYSLGVEPHTLRTLLDGVTIRRAGVVLAPTHKGQEIDVSGEVQIGYVVQTEQIPERWCLPIFRANQTRHLLTDTFSFGTHYELGVTHFPGTQLTTALPADSTVDHDRDITSVRLPEPTLSPLPIGINLGAGQVRGQLNYRAGLETMADSGLGAGFVVDESGRHRTYTPYVIAASPWIVILPSFGLAVGVPVRDTGDVGARLEGSIHVGPVGLVAFYDLIVGAGSYSGLLLQLGL